jgi:hypothetical protein
MLKSEKKTPNPVWLKFPSYRVVGSKPEFNEHVAELERAVQMGIPAYPDLSRRDFYDVALKKGWAYIHIYRDRCAVYLIAYLSTFKSLPVTTS